jgi:hypothetical protein
MAQTMPTSSPANHMSVQFVDASSAVKPVFWQPNVLQQPPQPKTMAIGLIHGIFLCITLTALILGIKI